MSRHIEPLHNREITLPDLIANTVSIINKKEIQNDNPIQTEIDQLKQILNWTEVDALNHWNSGRQEHIAEQNRRMVIKLRYDDMLGQLKAYRPKAQDFIKTKEILLEEIDQNYLTDTLLCKGCPGCKEELNNFAEKEYLDRQIKSAINRIAFLENKLKEQL